MKSVKTASMGRVPLNAARWLLCSAHQVRPRLKAVPSASKQVRVAISLSRRIRCSFLHERLVVPSKLKVLHFAPAAEYVGSSGGRIIDHALPLHHWRLLSPHGRSGHRGGLMTGTTEDMY